MEVQPAPKTEEERKIAELTQSMDLSGINKDMLAPLLKKYLEEKELEN